MKYYSLKILVLISILLTSCKERRKSPGTLIGESIYISGSIKGDTIKKDSVRIAIGGLIPFNQKIGVTQSVAYTNNEGEFSFTSPIVNELTRITLVTYRKRAGNNGARFSDALRDYLIAPGDSIHIIVDKDKEETSFSFSGKGAKKFTCRWAVDQLGHRVNKKVSEEKRKTYTLSLVEQYKRKLRIADSVIAIQLRELSKYKGDMEVKAYQLMKADIIGEANTYLKDFWYANIKNASEKEIWELQKLLDKSLVVDVPDSIVAMSPQYVRYLSAMTIAKLILENPQEGYNFETIYTKRFGLLCARLRNDFKGFLREKLLLYNLQNLKIQDTYGMEECLKESYNLVRTPALKKIIARWYGKKLRGAKAYDFVLPDTVGRMVRLKDFREKVVYVDIWFTRCSGCASLAEKVDRVVYPKFKDNPEVVFVSISMDKSRERWLKSVREEKYGLKEYVNLYTDGMGFDHPFIKYYDIQGGPTTMLIDRKGQIFSAAPPKHYDNDGMKGLIALIEEAIAGNQIIRDSSEK